MHMRVSLILLCILDSTSDFSGSGCVMHDQPRSRQPQHGERIHTAWIEGLYGRRKLAILSQSS